MPRAFLIVLDSVGCGAAACAAGQAEAGRSGPLRLPHLGAMGLGAAIRLASGMEAPGLPAPSAGRWAAATEVSRGKDTPSGHWELAGVPVPWDWTYFPDTEPAFPEDLVAEVCALAGTEGILGNRHASGTLIIEDSMLSGNPSDGFETQGYPGIFYLGRGDPQVQNSTLE